MPSRLPGADRRQHILAVAQHLFAAHGFHATTAREIARAAEVSDALMYLYFRSKQEVFEAIIEAGMHRFEQSAHRTIPADLPIADFLLQAGQAFLQLLVRERELLPLLVSIQLVLPGDLRWVQFIEQLAQQGGQALDQRAVQGELRQDLPGYLIARQFFGDLVSYVVLEEVLGMRQVQHVPPETYLNTVIGCLLRGILP